MTVILVSGLLAASLAIIPAGIVTDAFPSAEGAVTVLLTSPVGSVETEVSPAGAAGAAPPPG
ncbi:MAG: hypothetical protein QMD22_11290 [archaeon]|nr:hypothetical protein [archaeon]